ncbi:MAG TPA: polysaccharide deacetylase family protein, partial [Firmicutes bacterium]|nr:polysaccharide deacetylase family protein [Bacillota bacterium]
MSEKRIFIGHMFNFNLQFAEMPVDKTELLVTQGQEPLLDVLDAHPSVKADLFFTGYTDEWLEKNAPRVVDRVKAGVSSGRFGIGTYTYAHPILSLLPYEDVVRQLAKGLECDERTWGTRPVGLLLPEVAWDVSLPRALNQLGIQWVAIYKEIIPALADSSSYPGVVWAEGAFGVRAKAVLGNRVLGKAVQGVLRGEIPTERIVKMIMEMADSSRQDQFILLKQDAEVLYFATMAYHMEKGALSWGDRLPDVEAARRFDDVLTRLEEIPGVRFVTIEEYLQEFSPTDVVFPECISGHADMDKWTRGEGRERLNVLTDTAREEIRAATYAIDLLGALGKDTGQAKAILEDAWLQLMLAENSDGRAFVPHASRKIAVATAAIKAGELARKS